MSRIEFVGGGPLDGSVQEAKGVYLYERYRIPISKPITRFQLETAPGPTIEPAFDYCHVYEVKQSKSGRYYYVYIGEQRL